METAIKLLITKIKILYSPKNENMLSPFCPASMGLANVAESIDIAAYQQRSLVFLEVPVSCQFCNIFLNVVR